MAEIEVLVPRNHTRSWQVLVVERLRRNGHDVRITPVHGLAPWGPEMDAVLSLERKLLRSGRSGLAERVVLESSTQTAPASGLILDLCGTSRTARQETGRPVMSLLFENSFSPEAALLAVAAGKLPTLHVVLNASEVVGTARPMLDTPALVGSSLEDVLARAITVVVATVERFAAGTLARGVTLSLPPVDPTARLWTIGSYGTKAAPRLFREVLRRTRFRQAHWRVGYRFIDGPGVAETARLGDGWTVLLDGGERFYADPFPIEWAGGSHIFLEDYPHDTRKAVISVASFDGSGQLGKPRPVLEEPYHLSYPQVFVREGTAWMLPESSSGDNLVLYRAERFPDRWVRHAVLMQGRQVSDATLLEHGGRLWLFATDRDGYGSTSDTLVVFSAEQMEGPWRAHRDNPILIDRSAARPGGGFVSFGGHVILPVQDGTLGYGGGLGLAKLERLDDEAVQLSAPVPIDPVGDWPYKQIHTLNRCGRLEVIDGIAAVRKR